MDSFSESILLTSALLTTLLLFLFWRTRQARKQQIKRYQQGISLLQLLRVTLTKTQQHRGLSNGFLHGDRSTQGKISQLQREIAQQSVLLETNSRWLVDNERWLAIKDHWQRLSTHYINHQPSYSLAQHNKLILSILHLIEDCAEQHHLQELGLQEQTSIEHLWKSLLFNAEFIGQARAVGTGVTTAKRCRSVERIRLKYLHSKLSDYHHSLSGAACSRALSSLLTTIETEVIINQPKISSSKYFNLATRALETSMKEFDQGLSELSQQVATRSIYRI